jgi:hypothetical protein
MTNPDAVQHTDVDLSIGARRSLELPSHEALSHLALNDPLAYEALRRKLIETFIDSAPARIKPRLNGIQFRVDSLRRLSRSALGATLRVYKLMWESFYSLDNEWQNFIHVKNECADTRRSTLTTGCVAERSAQLIEFKPHSPRDKHIEPASLSM